MATTEKLAKVHHCDGCHHAHVSGASQTTDWNAVTCKNCLKKQPAPATVEPGPDEQQGTSNETVVTNALPPQTVFGALSPSAPTKRAPSRSGKCDGSNQTVYLQPIEIMSRRTICTLCGKTDLAIKPEMLADKVIARLPPHLDPRVVPGETVTNAQAEEMIARGELPPLPSGGIGAPVSPEEHAENLRYFESRKAAFELHCVQGPEQPGQPTRTYSADGATLEEAMAEALAIVDAWPQGGCVQIYDADPREALLNPVAIVSESPVEKPLHVSEYPKPSGNAKQRRQERRRREREARQASKVTT